MEINEDSVLELLHELNIANRKLNDYYPKTKWSDAFKEKIKIDFTYQSNKIEGNTLTYNDTFRFLKEAAVIKGKSVKDILDVKNHFEILSNIFDDFEQPISIVSILDLHQNLMKDPEQWDFYSHFSPGHFKLFANYTIRPSGKTYEYMKPELVEKSMIELVQATNQSIIESDLNRLKYHPVSVASHFHNRFVYIHPFEDGNGRMGRILVNQILMKTDFPPLILKEEEKSQYFDAIVADHDQGNTLLTVYYFANTLLNQIKTILNN